MAGRYPVSYLHDLSPTSNLHLAEESIEMSTNGLARIIQSYLQSGSMIMASSSSSLQRCVHAFAICVEPSSQSSVTPNDVADATLLAVVDADFGLKETIQHLTKEFLMIPCLGPRCHVKKFLVDPTEHMNKERC